MSTQDLRRAFRDAPWSTLFSTALGAGLSPIAPGTAGSAVGLVLAWLVATSLGSSHGPSVAAAVGLLMSGLVVAAVGVPIATRTCRQLQAKDPGCIVIDEVAGQLLSVCPAPLFLYPNRSAEIGVWLLSFFAFRFFDVVKPGPVRRLQELPEGLGVVVDDVLAGLLAAGTVAVAAWVVSGGKPWT
ncbi:MAG TPA: phosphatidylglycerophosphatase A [Thermoanaerobaculia bacterium]|nr:phosphatidylglycerophosphatase A [Thermoanaerobaculia bacterium]